MGHTSAERVAGWLRVGRHTDPNRNQISLLRFGLSDESGAVAQAVLKLRGNSLSTRGLRRWLSGQGQRGARSRLERSDNTDDVSAEFSARKAGSGTPPAKYAWQCWL